MQKTIEIFPENLEMMTLNMGPQHPSTHGVLRLVIDLEGEVVRKITPDIGYLHRGKEKTAEVKTYHQFIPYTDRLDYLSPMSNNYAFVSTVEKLLGIDVTPRATYLRTLLCELARISSHLLWLGSQAMELGAATVFLYIFRERETIYDLFEAISGHRFTVSYMRIGGMARDIPDGWLEKVQAFTDDFPKRVTEYEDLLTLNEIFLQRTKGVGMISAADAIDLGLTGPSLRASDVRWDIRKSNPYLAYGELDWEMAVGTGCDVYERYLVRIEEMRQSNRIVQQCIQRMPDGPVNIDNPKVIYPPRDNVHKSMEDLIHHFMLAYEGFRTPEGEVYNSIEAPKGELGFYIYSDGSNKPYRLKIRAPSFVNLQSLARMCKDRLFADVVAVIGSLDIVLGESDR